MHARCLVNINQSPHAKVACNSIEEWPSEQSWFPVRLNEGIIILPHQESPSACLNKKELSQTRANCVRFTPNCKIRHLRREALLGCSAFLELLALTFCEVRAIPVSEWYKFWKSTFKLGLDIPSMVSNFLLWCEMFFYDEKISHCCLKFGGSL